MSKGGRPSKYSETLADKICEKIASSAKGLNAICKEDGMPNRGEVYKWLAEIPAFQNKYARAKELQAELMAEEILDIADETSKDTITVTIGETEIDKPNNEWIARSKLRIDTRKWLMSKLLPKKFGDKLEIEETNNTFNVVIK